MNDAGSPHHPEALEARERLAALSPRVYEAIEIGIEIGRDHFGDRPLDPWLFPHLVRFEAVQRLAGVSGTLFQVEQNPMSGIEISCAGYEIRVFKRCGTDGGEFLYPPGHSTGRQDFYRQMTLPGTGHLMLHTPSNIAYVWERTSDGLELHLVCPDGFDGIWKPGRSRWSIEIPHPALTMDPDQDFADEDDDLPINLDEAESGPDDDAT